MHLARFSLAVLLFAEFHLSTQVTDHRGVTKADGINDSTHALFVSSISVGALATMTAIQLPKMIIIIVLASLTRWLCQRLGSTLEMAFQ